MTVERYNFLCALSIFSRDQFTVEDIVRFTKMPKATVATFLNRETRYVERIGTIPTGRRGGQIAQYRVRPETIRMLENESNQLTGIEASVKKLSEGPAPPSLIVAEDTVLRLLPKATNDERSRTIEVAKFLIANAEMDVRTRDNGRNSGGLQQRLKALKEQLREQENKASTKESESVEDPTRVPA